MKDYNTSYYKKFRIIIGNPLFSKYLKFQYEKGIEDLKKLNFYPNFKKKNFTAFLCGVGNEQTAKVFIDFVINLNPKAKITIIDLEKEQINAVKNLVADELDSLKMKLL